MAKILVVDSAEGVRVPFLRGILTRSLQDCGLDFDDAYELATVVRDELAGTDEITNDELRVFVAEHLDVHGDEIVDRYLRPLALGETFRLVGDDGQNIPFSRDRHASTLECAGISHEQAREIAEQLYRNLTRRGVAEIHEGSLTRETFRLTAAGLGDEAARRYAVWEAFRRSGRPLVLLLGGITGCGKSTVATQIAHLAGVVRVQSTDLLREVMRMMTPQRLLPALHRHSFDAWRALPGHGSAEGDEHEIADGYLTQAELLAVACEATVQRSLRERVSLILEGVHVHPDLLDRVAPGADAVVVDVMLAVLKSKELRRRLKGRGRQAPARHAKLYLEDFDALWRLQSFLLSEADRKGMHIIANENLDRTVERVMRRIVDVVETRIDVDMDAIAG